MATEEEVLKALKILASAGLRGAPDKETLRNMAELWIRHLKEIPGRALLQAADDMVITEEYWPSLKRVRDAAYQVKIHNFTSAAPNPWKDESRTTFVVPGIFTITRDGWIPFTVDPANPRQQEPETFPPEVQAQLDDIEERTGGIYGEEEYRLIDEITAPYLRPLGR